MTRTVLIHEAAVDEAVEAAAWYEAKREGLGDEFQRAIDVALDLVEEAIVPLSQMPRTADAHTKRLRLRRFLILGYGARLQVALTATRGTGIKVPRLRYTHPPSTT